MPCQPADPSKCRCYLDFLAVRLLPPRPALTDRGMASSHFRSLDLRGASRGNRTIGRVEHVPGLQSLTEKYIVLTNQMKRATVGEAMTAVMTLYPRIYFACHTRHVRDPQSQRLLSRHQASILDHLDEIEPTTVMELAGHMGVTAATMSLSIDRLERKGYVVRVKDAKDRRRVHVRLTTAGVRVRDASSVLDAARVEALVARLTEEERARAIEGLALLAHAGS